MVKNTNIPLKINLYSLMLIITFVFVIGCGMENKKRSEAKAKGDFLLEAIAEGKAVELFPKDLFPIEQTRAVMHDLQHKCDFKNRKGVFVNDYYQKNEDPILKNKNVSSDKIDKDDNEVVEKIKNVLDTKIRPAVARDGGDIKFKSFKDGVVHVELQGSCSGCPSSVMTLKQGVQNLLKHYIREVQSVEAI